MAYGGLLGSDAPSPADGVMCAMDTLNGVPSCVDDLLLTTMLRDRWGSDAIVQTDCCDSLGSTGSFLKKPPDAVLAAYLAAGGGAYFGFDVTLYKNLMTWGLGKSWCRCCFAAPSI